MTPGPTVVLPETDPPNAELLSIVASLFDAMPGERIKAPLSRLIENVCATCCPEGGADRALRLELELAEYLVGWRVIRHEQESPAGLDAWAAKTPIVFLRAAVAGCARCQRADGDAR
jgi:hypothetical protein